MPDDKQYMIEAKNISFSYGKKSVLRDISFKVKAGECLVLAGVNGAGKSTLMTILAGLRRAKTGEVVCRGKIGYLPQGISLFEDMTVEDNLRFFAGISKCKVPENLPFSLDLRRKERVGKLSMGQKRQVSIACTLLGEPEILMFDEPAASLDVVYRDELIQWLLQTKKEGRTIIYVGHDPIEFVELYDKLLILGEEAQYFERKSLSDNQDDNSVFYKNYINIITNKEKDKGVHHG